MAHGRHDPADTLKDAVGEAATLRPAAITAHASLLATMKRLFDLMAAGAGCLCSPVHCNHKIDSLQMAQSS
jgi:hypothetical protein